MQKKLLVAAVLATLSGAAFSQAANVTLYGRLNVGLDSWSATGATDPTQNFERRNRVFDSGSRVGLRGTEDLGNGLRAFYQIETGVNVDSGSANGQSGVANASSGTWASRASFVGVGGSWGDVRFGRQDIYWTGGTVDQVGANYLHMGSNILSGFGGHVATPAARNSNVMSYNSPNWNGLTASVYYNPSAEGVAVSNPGAAGVTPKSRVWGLTGRYVNGPFAVNFDWADNKSANNNSTTANVANDAKTASYKLAGAWTYGAGQVSLGYVDSRDTKNAGLSMVQTIATGAVAANAVAAPGVLGTTGALGVVGVSNTLMAYNVGDTLRQKSWMLGWEHTFGNTMAIVQYGRAGQVTGSTHNAGMSNTGHTQMTLGVRHNLSKRTALYAAYVTMRNQSNSFSDINGGGMSSAGAAMANTSIGAKPTSLGMGIWHQF